LILTCQRTINRQEHEEDRPKPIQRPVTDNTCVKNNDPQINVQAHSLPMMKDRSDPAKSISPNGMRPRTLTKTSLEEDRRHVTHTPVIRML
jgi:hypothetical protein